MSGRTCGACERFAACSVGHTREREGRAPCLDWVPRAIELQTGKKPMSGREFFERYGIPAADLQGEGEGDEG